MTTRPVGLIVSAAVLASAVCCGSAPRVSPWPQNVTLGTLLRPSDVKVHLARLDDELGAESMAMTEELRGTFEDGEPFVIRAYRGLDPLGHERDAVRVATRFGVVMALGPSPAADALQGMRTRLVVGLGEGEQWRSGTDLNGDGMPDVVVSVGRGELQIWGLHPQGGSPYATEMLLPPTYAGDIDGDGRPELMGEVDVGTEVLTPRWVEVASFAHGVYSADSDAARAAHARWQRGMPEEPEQPGASRAAGMVRALERGWHAIRSGAEWEPTLARLRRDKAELGEGTLTQEASWSRWVQRLASVEASRGRVESEGSVRAESTNGL